jgi:CRISPR-associated endonuclease Cas2
MVDGRSRRGAKPWNGPRVGDARVDDGLRDRVLAVFDVEGERARRKLRELCKDYGLLAVQRSAFDGRMSGSRRRELFERGRRLLLEHKVEARWMVLVVDEREGRGVTSASVIDGVDGAP